MNMNNQYLWSVKYLHSNADYDCMADKLEDIDWEGELILIQNNKA